MIRTFFIASSFSPPSAGVANANGITLPPFDGLHRDRLAAEGRLDHVLNVADIDAVAGVRGGDYF